MADLAVAGLETAEETAARRTAENREIAAISGPALINTLIDPFLSLVDTLVVGRTCAAIALGAVSASSELFTIAFAASLALRESASSTIVRLLAQGRRSEARTFAAKTLQLALGVGAALALLMGGPSASWCVGLMGCPAGSPLYPDALAYVRTRALALPAALAISASEGIFRGMGNTRAPLRAALCAGLANMVLDPALMIWPFRRGVAGAAAATAAAQVVACALLLRALRQELFSSSSSDDSSAASSTTTGEGDGAAVATVATTGVDADADADAIDAAAEADAALAAAKEAEAAARRQLAGTSAATLLRTCSVRVPLPAALWVLPPVLVGA